MTRGQLFLIVPACEVMLAFGFAAAAQVFSKRLGLDFRSIAKGILERGFLVMALLLGYPHALTFFSALKLATRLKREDKPDENFNDYYLVGNLISVAAAMGYTELFRTVG